MSKGNRRPDLAERNRAQHTGPHLYEDASWMRDAYEVRRLSLRQMAKEAGCAHRTVVRWMEIHGIPTRDLRTALSLLDHKGEKSRNWKGGRPSCAGCGKQIGWRCTHCVQCRDISGERNSNWRGEKVSYAGAHSRVKAARGPASDHRCVRCGNVAREWAYDNADPDEKFEGVVAFSLKPEHYLSMCCKCHRRSDGERRRAELLAARRKARDERLDLPVGGNSGS